MEASWTWDAARATGHRVWRYRSLLPALDDRPPVSLAEGGTPLLNCERLAHWAGVRELRVKVEGANPTGSFKDRGMTVGVTLARALGAMTLACASTGNTSASLAAYGARAGLPVTVYLPKGKIAFGKMAQAIAFEKHKIAAAEAQAKKDAAESRQNQSARAKKMAHKAGQADQAKR